MNIFISHSLKDKELINSLKNTLKPHGLNLFIAEYIIDPHRTITEKVEKMISMSDYCIILLTKNGLKSKFVQQEIGFIKGKSIPFISLVESGMESEIEGLIYGRDFVSLDPNTPINAISTVKSIILNELNKIIQRDNLIIAGLMLLVAYLVISLLNQSE